MYNDYIDEVDPTFVHAQYVAYEDGFADGWERGHAHAFRRGCIFGACGVTYMFWQNVCLKRARKLDRKAIRCQRNAACLSEAARGYDPEYVWASSQLAAYAAEEYAQARRLYTEACQYRTWAREGESLTPPVEDFQ